MACGPWRQAHPPSTGPQPLHGCAPGPGHGSRIRCVAWGSSSKAPPCVAKRVLLALDASLDQICVKDSLIAPEACHRQVQQAPTPLCTQIKTTQT